MERHFASICGSSLWNPAIVYSNHPDLTFCFQHTLLIWTPCFLVWFSAPLWIFMLTKPTSHKIKASWLLFIKTIVTLALVLIEVLNLVRAFREQSLLVYFMTPLILLCTYVFVLLITHYERYNGWRNSTVVFLFWFTLFMASTVTLRSKLIYETNRENTKYLTTLKRQYLPDADYIRLSKLTELDLFTFYIYYFLVGFNTLLSIFSENVDHKSKSAEITASLISKLTFWWTDKLIRTGFRKELTREDLFEIDEREKVERNTQTLEGMWTPRAHSYIMKIREIEARVDPSYVKDQADQEKINLNPRKDESVISEEIKKVRQPSFAWCLVQIHVYKFIGLLSIKLAHDLLNLARPILLDKLISFVMDKEQSMSVGLFYIGLLCLSSLTQTLIMQHYYHTMFLMGNRIKNSVMQLIFNKSLRLSTSARKSTTVGEMTNILTTNTHSFDFCMFHFVSCVSVPIQLAMSIYLLWMYIGGAATLAGLASMVLFLPLNGVFGRFSKKMRRQGYRLTDARIKVLNELLNGIRVVKFYGWEKSFQEIIIKLRNNELLLSIKLSLTSTLMSLTWSCAPIAITVISFGTYLSLNEKNNLDPNTAFVSLTLFSMLRFPLNMLPHLINAFIQLNVSITRIRGLLLKDELKGEDVSHESAGEDALIIDNISFGWSKNESSLKDIKLRIKKGQLVAIIGKVGSGKSSLMSAIIGEMHKLNNNKLNIDGTTSYVAQQAWIKNDTVKNNIVFNAANGFDELFYNRVVRDCQLVPDLEIMPASDQTEIGEKGINLSGGQKQRISLARAVYANTDIYLLDDPLSAVDAHVGKNLFDLVLGPNGMLKDKTRVLVTNSLNFLEKADMIVMLDNGCIVEQGTYSELKKNETNAFNEFVRTYFEKKEQLRENLSEQTADVGEEIVETAESDGVKRSVSRSYSRQKSHVSAAAKEEQPLLLSAGGKKESEGKIIEKEKIESGSVKWSVIWAYIKACRWYVSIVFVLFYILSSVSDMGSSYWLSSWSDQVTADRETANRRKFYYLTIYASLGFSKSFINFLGNVCFVGMFIKATRFFHDKMLYSVLRGQLRFFESTPSGRIVNRFTKDIDATQDSIPYSIKSIIECLLGLASTVIIICSSTPYFILALVPITIFYIMVQRYYVPTNRQLKRLQKASKSPIFSHFSETQAGISTIRAYNGQKWVKKIMEESINEYFVYYYCNAVSNRWLALRLEVLGNIITIMAAVFAIFAKNNLSAGLAGLSISISLTISSNLNWLVRTLSEFEANITSMERIIEYFDIKQEPEWTIEDTKPRGEWPEAGSVVLKNYSLKYRPELDKVLSDLNLKINPGEKIGIVGRTGAGKSSLTLALFRLLEHTEGDIIIDGVNINKIGVHDLRHKLTIIPQDPVIFSGTIRMNLDPFKMYTDEEIWRSLELSHLKEFVSGQEKKLEFECSEGGENLSVGQRQLICLARALLRKTKILILDEATASIDYNTDELIQETIRSQFDECTVLTIAHRLNTIMDSSRILVLDKGRVAEFDTPQSLLSQKSGIFYSMAKNAGLV